MKKELTVIQRILYYSKCILILKIVLGMLEKIKTLLASIPVPFYKTNTAISEIVSEIKDRITQYEIKIKLLLHPLFKGNDFGYDPTNTNWHFTAEDMQRGYLHLEKINSTDGNSERFILLLSNYKDSKFDLHEGDLLPFTKVATILGNLKDTLGNTPKVNSYLANQLTRTELIPKVRRLRINQKENKNDTKT